jgi:hypothetical protein
MEAPQKLVRNSIIFIYVIVIGLQLMNCTTGKANKSYGKYFFNENCSVCHYKKYDGIEKSPGLLTLSKYDSVTLAEKMRGIKQDSIHGIILQTVKYSDKEINSICEFIKDYYKMDY